MKVTFHYFHEKTHTDYEVYQEHWEQHRYRFIFLPIHLSHSQQLIRISEHIREDLDGNRDILVVRYPDYDEILHNSILKDVTLGKGILYEPYRIWYPKEVWIYCPCS
jgi:hypothetical protein